MAYSAKNMTAPMAEGKGERCRNPDMKELCFDYYYLCLSTCSSVVIRRERETSMTQKKEKQGPLKMHEHRTLTPSPSPFGKSKREYNPSIPRPPKKKHQRYASYKIHPFHLPSPISPLFSLPPPLTTPLPPHPRPSPLDLRLILIPRPHPPPDPLGRAHLMPIRPLDPTDPAIPFPILAACRACMFSGGTDVHAVG